MEELQVRQAPSFEQFIFAGGEEDGRFEWVGRVLVDEQQSDKPGMVRVDGVEPGIPGRAESCAAGPVDEQEIRAERHDHQFLVRT